MEPILKSILENKTENYLLPFFWQHDGHDAEIPARVQKISMRAAAAHFV